jgi:hypothetical protein
MSEQKSERDVLVSAFDAPDGQPVARHVSADGEHWVALLPGMSLAGWRYVREPRLSGSTVVFELLLRPKPEEP